MYNTFDLWIYIIKKFELSRKSLKFEKSSFFVFEKMPNRLDLDQAIHLFNAATTELINITNS